MITLGTGLGTKALGKYAYAAPTLIKRLFVEQASNHRRRYFAAFVLMAIAAAATALPALLTPSTAESAVRVAITSLSLSAI